MLSPGYLVSSGLGHGASPSRVSLYLHTWPGEMGRSGAATQAARPDPKPLGHPSQGNSVLGTQGISHLLVTGGFPGGAGGKEPAGQCRRHERCGFDLWVGKTPGGGHGNPLQYSCLENPMDRGAWRTADHRVTKSQIQLKQLSADCLC